LLIGLLSLWWNNPQIFTNCNISMDDLATIYAEMPADFKPSIIAAACYCEFEQRILFLKRNAHKPLGNAWGVPAGKLENNESPQIAVIREIFEEIGLQIQEDELIELPTIYVRRSRADVILHRFRISFTTLPLIKSNLEEHSKAQWFTIDEALNLPQITGAVKALKYYECEH
jgi:8-oxo-dGTP diphosphatase